MTSHPEPQLDDILCSDRSGPICAAGGGSGTRIHQHDIATDTWASVIVLPGRRVASSEETGASPSDGDIHDLRVLDVKSGEMGIRGVGPEEACLEDPDLQVHGALVMRRVPITAARG